MECKQFSNQLMLIDPVNKRICDEEFKNFYMKTDAKSPKNGGLFQRFQSWNKLVRVLARIIQFIATARSGYSTKIARKPKRDELPGIKKKIEEDKTFFDNHLLTNLQIEEAEKLVFCIAKYLVFQDEIASLKKEGRVEKSSRLSKIKVFWDPEDCFIRMVSREPSTSIVVIPKKQRTSELFVRHQHIIHNHAGTASLVSLVEKKFYLPGGIHEFKRIVRCCGCRKYKQLKQIMAELPPERTTVGFKAFLAISCHYCGPFYVYEGP